MLAIILVVLAFVAIAGVGIYYYMDMKDHKATNSTDFEKVTKNIDEEKSTRLGNIKYIVDQVNTTNEAMDTSYNEKLDALEKTDTGFGKLIKTGPDTSPTEIKDTLDPQHINLMKHVSIIGGMSIKDLQNTAAGTAPAKIFKACGTGASPTCIEFPNSEGDTYLTALNDANKSVVSGSVFKAKKGLLTDTIGNLGSTSNISISTGSAGNTITVSNNVSGGIDIVSGDNRIQVNSAGINIVTETPTNPSSIFRINGGAVGIVGIGSTANSDEIATALKNKQILTLTHPVP